MSDDIGLGLSSMAVCFDFCSTNVVQLSNRNPYFYRFRCHHPLTTQLSQGLLITFVRSANYSASYEFSVLFIYII